jgi:hypothetical protein
MEEVERTVIEVFDATVYVSFLRDPGERHTSGV